MNKSRHWLEQIHQTDFDFQQVLQQNFELAFVLTQENAYS